MPPSCLCSIACPLTRPAFFKARPLTRPAFFKARPLTRPRGEDG